MAFVQTFNAGKTRLKSLFSRASTKPPAHFGIKEESLARYCPGGYHPVRIGDTFKDGKYLIVNKLGFGLYSTVWLARNLESKNHVALKILTADTFGGEKDTFEVDILQHLRAKSQTQESPKARHILGLLDKFEHRGPNGNHVCLVFKAMGPDMSYYRKILPKASLPPALMKETSKQLLLALAYLHDDCNVIHTDIKPQNILIETDKTNDVFQNAPVEVFEPEFASMDPPNDFYMLSKRILPAGENFENPPGFSIRLADFGTSSWFDKHLTEWIQPESLRAPEVILGASWDHKADIWNLGTVIWELAQGAVLFDGTWDPQAQYTTEAHLAQITAILGSFTKELLNRSSRCDQYFDEHGDLRQPSTFPACSLGQFCNNSDMSVREKEMFVRFVESMLRVNPAERIDARDLLKSEWLRNDV